MTASVLNSRPEKFASQTGIDDDAINKLKAGLRAALSDTYVLLVRTYGHHRNEVEPLFVSIHELTGQRYEDLARTADELAERIRALGDIAPMTYREMIDSSDLSEHEPENSAVELVSGLADDHAATAKRMREVAKQAEEVGDLVTSDLLAGRITSHEKAARMLRALLTGG